MVESGEQVSMEAGLPVRGGKTRLGVARCLPSPTRPASLVVSGHWLLLARPQVEENRRPRGTRVELAAAKRRQQPERDPNPAEQYVGRGVPESLGGSTRGVEDRELGSRCLAQGGLAALR